ncbi:MAG TPA: flagellar filament capping protein FliD [Nocardioidaceae bacterium]|nr:flagellar filament capping protein FliD [Nocardioidaceae bacterium]
MANASISGLASGLDTATIISQLMQLEAAPQTRLKSRLSAEQSTLGILQSINAKLSALMNRAKDLDTGADWSPFKVTSSNELVSATATASAVPGTVSFTVNQVASAHKLSFANTAALTDVVTTGSTQVKLTEHDGTVHTLETGDGTLQGLLTALGTQSGLVSASTVKLDDGTYRLSVQSATTGATSDFTVTNLDGSALLGGANVTAGADAAITIGPDTVHSSTNTFTGVLPGIDVTIGATTPPGTSVQVTVARDVSSAADDLKSLVDSINEILTDLDTQSSYNSVTKKAGPLAGDAGVRALRDLLLNAVYDSNDSGLASLGVQVDRKGRLTFDKDAFTTAYGADPAGVSAKLGSATGFAARVAAAADAGCDPVEGTVTAAVTGRTAATRRLQDSIEAWDVRLELRRTTLSRQFTALETALSQMQGQSSWLAGQLSALSANSSS